jgi:hypothetical protein
MHKSPTNTRLQKELTQRLFLVKFATNKPLNNDEAVNKIEPTSNVKSRNNGTKYSKTSSTFEHFYTSQMEFQKRKYSKMQLSSTKKYVQE